MDLIDPYLNWPIRVNINPVYLFFVSTSEQGGGLHLGPSYLLFCKVWFACTFFLLLLFSPKLKPFLIVLSLLLNTTVVLTVNSEIFWAAIHILPLSALLLLFAQQVRISVPWIILAALSWSYLGGPVAVLGAILFLVVSSRLNRPSIWTAVSLSLSVLFMPVFEMPDYPAQAQLNTLSPASFWPEPLIGPKIQPNPLEYQAFLEKIETLSHCALFSVLCAAFLILGLRLKNLISISEIRNTVIFLAPLLLVSSQRSAESIFATTLFRSCYGLALLPYPIVVIELVLLFGVMKIFFCDNRHNGHTIVLFSTVVFFFFVEALQSPTAFSSTATTSNPAEWFSRRVEAKYPENWLNLIPGSRFSPDKITLSSNVHNSDLPMLFDKNLSTRWSTQRAQQGGEFINLDFPSPVVCPFLELNLGAFPGDFPRGISVETLSPMPNEKWQLLYSIPDWIGPLRYTSHGLAYIGNQSDYILALGIAPVIGIKLKQTGRDEFHFWSVAEIYCREAISLSSR